MGSSCCHTESPCGSVEERSVLLKDDAKATVSTGNPIVVGTCGPQEDDELRITLDKSDISTKVKAEAVQVKKCLEVGQPNNTQENGPLKESYIQTAAPSPRKGSDLKENSTRAQDEDMMDSLKDSEDSGQIGLLQCTLNSPQKDQDTDDLPEANTAPEDVNSASAQDKPPDINPQSAEVACLENHTGIEAAMECSISAPQYDNEEAGSKIDNAETEVLGQFCEKNEGLSLPNTQLTTAACQLLSISVVSEEMESLSCAVTEDLDNGSSSVCKESCCEIRTSHDVCESSSGSDPAEIDHSGEKQGAAHYVGEPATTASEDASERSKPDQDAKPNLSCVTTVSEEVTSLENTDNEIVDEIMLKGQDKDGEEKDEMKEELWRTPTGDGTPPGKDAESQEASGKEEQLEGELSTGVAADEIAASEKEVFAEDGLGNSEEDLYRGAEELSAGPPPKFLKLEDRCSLAPAIDILSYSEREWKGNTAKSALIRKGYKEMSQRFCHVRRVRGDNYCALRATLFQVLSHSHRLPSWLQGEDFTMLPKQLEAQEGLIRPWLFPGECLQGDGTGDATLQLQGYMEQLWTKWQAAVDCSSATERQELCEQVFQGGEEEFGLMEALKLLMLSRAVELHASMQAGGDVPLFCWLLFARDSSDCPRSFLSNHLSHVGLSAGLEQVEMFLLGYALQCTIQVYRLYKADTEEFVTYYPDDHKDDWPSVCLVTEDDRHYNVPIVEAAEHKKLDSS